jgi:hypothetical protein
MQPPPPTGCTGNAPPGVDGDGGAVDSPDEVADDVITVIAVMSPTAKTSAATQIPHAAAVLAFPFPTTDKCSDSGPDAQNTRGLRGSRRPHGCGHARRCWSNAQPDLLPHNLIPASTPSGLLGPTLFREPAGRERELEDFVAERGHCLAEGYAADGSFAHNRS